MVGVNDQKGSARGRLPGTTLERHQDLVIALRSTEARRYTLRDTPIFTAVHRPLEEALALLG